MSDRKLAFFPAVFFFLTLRSVPLAQRSYALGLQMGLIRVLGAIPGPIVFGILIDKTCILWNTR